MSAYLSGRDGPGAIASSRGLRNLCSAQLNHSTTSGQSGTTTTEQKIAHRAGKRRTINSSASQSKNNNDKATTTARLVVAELVSCGRLHAVLDDGTFVGKNIPLCPEI